MCTSDDDNVTEIAPGDHYRLVDDGTVFEVAGVAESEVDVGQYDDAGDREGEYTTTVEEFRREIVDLVE